MKKVINPKTKTNTVIVEEVNVYKFYGVVVNNTNKGFIRRMNMVGGNFTILNIQDFTDGNCCNDYDSPLLYDSIKKMINGGVSVYEFDTFKELCEWLIQ